MIPHPPFASQLTPGEELAAFARLKSRLTEVWGALTASSQEPYTSVVVPSMTLDQEELRKIEGISFYEERLLFLLTRLRNPRAHLVYVTAQPVHPVILDYYLQLLVGVPASHARARLTMLCAYDASPRPLTQKVIERPRLLQRIRNAIPDAARAFLTVFNSTPLERKLAVLLGIPLNGVDPALSGLGTKSGSREIFREAGVAYPAGFENLRDRDDAYRALAELGQLRPGIRRAVLKLNDSFSGEGNAIFDYPDSDSPTAFEQAFNRIRFVAAVESMERYFDKFAAGGGVVEELIEAAEIRSPSAQLRTTPCAEVTSISTHDQILGGASEQIFLGCRFPADDSYRLQVQEAGRRVGEVLALRGVVSRFGVDFVVHREDPASPWQATAIEINLRMGGTTHPFLALRFLTGGELDERTGLFHSPSGRAKFYRATDNLCSDRYRGLVPEDLIDIVTVNQLNFDYRAECGVLFHLMGAVSQYGKLGVTAIGNSHQEAEELYDRALRILDVETRYR